MATSSIILSCRQQRFKLLFDETPSKLWLLLKQFCDFALWAWAISMFCLTWFERVLLFLVLTPSLYNIPSFAMNYTLVTTDSKLQKRVCSYFMQKVHTHSVAGIVYFIGFFLPEFQPILDTVSLLSSRATRELALRRWQTLILFLWLAQ